jgi:hypothetical protein
VRHLIQHCVQLADAQYNKVVGKDWYTYQSDSKELCELCEIIAQNVQYKSTACADGLRRQILDLQRQRNLRAIMALNWLWRWLKHIDEQRMFV